MLSLVDFINFMYLLESYSSEFLESYLSDLYGFKKEDSRLVTGCDFRYDGMKHAFELLIYVSEELSSKIEESLDETID